MATSYNKKVLLWLDTETTGLDASINKLLELAFVVTDNNLTVIDKFTAVVNYDQSNDPYLNTWCKEAHHNSGLFAECRGESSRSIADIDAMVYDRLRHYVDADKKLILCGNTIGFDRAFVKNEMPKLESILHYRMLDISSFRILLSVVQARVAKMRKQYGHRALPDILETLDEARYYLKYFDINKLNECSICLTKE